MNAPLQIRGVALVTGAADRIGATMAARLAAEGWAVVVHYRRSAEKAEALVEALTATGAHAAAVGADLSNRTERAGLIARASAHFGPLTLLVNNASSFEPDSAHDIDEALWDAHFSIHAEAPAFLSRDFAAQLPADTVGNIVNIVDERVLHLGPSHFSYSLSKTVLHTMTRTMAQSFAPRIRVNAIGPGPTLPEASQTAEQFAASLAPLPLGHGATPEDIADGLMYLLGAKAVTGQMLLLDGGRHLANLANAGKITPRRT